MLLKEIDEPFDSDDYIYEIKFDGIRAICYVSPKEITLISRNGKDMTNLFPELQSIKELVHENVIFDGEIIATDKGLPSFSKIQNRMHIKNKSLIEKYSLDDPVEFVVFDILYHKNKDLRDEPLKKRKEILEKYKSTEFFKISKIFTGSGIKLFKEIKKQGLEGIVAKNKESKYHINSRTDDFIKIKNIKSDEFYVGGYKDNRGAKTVSIILGEYRDKNFYYVGKVTISKKHKLYTLLTKLKSTKNPFIDQIEDCTFVKPTYLVTIEFLEKTKSGHLRHAAFKELKE